MLMRSSFTGSIRLFVGKNGMSRQIQQRARHSSTFSRSMGEKEGRKKLKRFSRALGSSEESSRFWFLAYLGTQVERRDEAVVH
jgi:hypothetical protein